jgi:hypothetical protein
MQAMALASIGALVVCFTLTVIAVEQKAVLNLRPDGSFNAKWDRCEERARKRGTPPGTVGYGDFMEDCMRQASPNKATAVGRR